MGGKQFDFGMIGLGTMGRNLVFNMSDHGYAVLGYDKNDSQAEILNNEAGDRNILATSQLHEFISGLKSPHVIMMLVPAGKIVDEVIRELIPFLSENDLLLDCGNSHFKDTNRRIDLLAKTKIHFMGVGVSGGEYGARNGPSIMPGGNKNIYERVSGMLQSISAKVNDEPCVNWLGPGSAGHYVKMVHNGIEYGLMQLIAESYHLLKVAGGFNNDDLHNIFSKWNEGILHSYLIEITAGIFAQKDDLTDEILIDKILDRAHQKGTGGWTSEDAMKLQVPIPVIDLAVAMRDLSANKNERDAIALMSKRRNINFMGNKGELVTRTEQTLYFSMITTYAQGMALLKNASGYYKYDLRLADIAKIWRGGCIIRSSLLEDIHSAFSQDPDLSNLLLNKTFSEKLLQSEDGIRKVIQSGVEIRIPLPAIMGSLAYYDSYRSEWLPANLIQAQRDFFGAHTYERNDREGIFHTQWNQEK